MAGMLKKLGIGEVMSSSSARSLLLGFIDFGLEEGSGSFNPLPLPQARDAVKLTRK